jgi:hypothetical protein
VLETAPVILQVASYKLTGKRLSALAPIHRHHSSSGLGRSQDHRALLIITAAGCRRPRDAETAMSDTATSRAPHPVVGLGKTGLSVGAPARPAWSAVAVIDTPRGAAALPRAGARAEAPRGPGGAPAA